MVSFDTINSWCSSTRSYENCFPLQLPVSSWEEIEWQKFIKVGLYDLYICIFADFSSFLISLISHLFPSSSLQVYFNQASLPNTSAIKALWWVVFRSNLVTLIPLLICLKKIFWLCKWRRLFCVFQNWSAGCSRTKLVFKWKRNIP